MMSFPFKHQSRRVLDRFVAVGGVETFTLSHPADYDYSICVWEIDSNGSATRIHNISYTHKVPKLRRLALADIPTVTVIGTNPPASPANMFDNNDSTMVSWVAQGTNVWSGYRYVFNRPIPVYSISAVLNANNNCSYSIGISSDGASEEQLLGGTVGTTIIYPTTNLFIPVRSITAIFTRTSSLSRTINWRELRIEVPVDKLLASGVTGTFTSGRTVLIEYTRG